MFYLVTDFFVTERNTIFKDIKKFRVFKQAWNYFCPGIKNQYSPGVVKMSYRLVEYKDQWYA